MTYHKLYTCHLYNARKMRVRWTRGALTPYLKLGGCGAVLLNKSILDQGWGMFRRMLAYKQTWRGGEVIAVNPRYTSQTCPQCGHVAKTNRVQQALFSCVACGYAAHADVNAARNILALGHRERLNACPTPMLWESAGISALKGGEDVNYTCAIPCHHLAEKKCMVVNTMGSRGTL